MSLDRLWAGWRSEYIAGVDATEVALSGAGGCVFCRILASGLADSETHVVWRDPAGRAIGILNAYPYASGHMMVMPTRHVGDIEALDPEESAAVWAGLRSGVAAMKAAFSPNGLNVGANLGRAAGAGIPGHLHLHVVPRWTGDTNFMSSVAEVRVLPEALSSSADRLRRAWPAL